jgi:hypothetical protein
MIQNLDEVKYELENKQEELDEEDEDNLENSENENISPKLKIVNNKPYEKMSMSDSKYTSLGVNSKAGE